ncbi:transposase [Streptomyces massasporeus]
MPLLGTFEVKSKYSEAPAVHRHGAGEHVEPPQLTPRPELVESSQRLGRHRWTIERTMAWLSGCCRLHRRYERKAAHFLTFASIACTIICYRRPESGRSRAGAQVLAAP